jgi:hypothetical protein
MITEPEYLSASQAAAYLGLHRSRLYQLTKVGLGQQIGGYWLYTKDELDAYKAAPKNKGGRPRSTTSASEPRSIKDEIKDTTNRLGY